MQGPLHVQQRLTRIVDRCSEQGLVVKFQHQERWDDLQRLSDLADKDANHDWLWAIHRHKAQRLEPDEYVAAVRLRLGCAGPEEPTICGNCGCSLLSCAGTHALLCAKGESTRGHNDIRNELHSMASSIDPASELEPEGLIASRPHLRPADVLTGAFNNGHLAAVDVGVISPSAAGAGSNCVATMDARKRERMEPYTDELAAVGVEFHPFALSCWGRLHPSALQMLRNLSKRIARREGQGSQRVVLQRLLARIATAVMRRAARMLLRCLPRSVREGDDGEVLAAPTLSPAVYLRAGDPGDASLPRFPGEASRVSPGTVPVG